MLTDIPAMFASRRVLVIGDAILDVYLKGVTEKLCREAPAPVLSLRARDACCGGAANTAINVAALGAKISFMSVIGADAHGSILTESFNSAGVDTGFTLTTPERATIAKTRVSAAANILLRIDEGTTDAIDDSQATRLTEHLREHACDFDAIIVSDYGYGVITDDVIQAIDKYRGNSVLIVDAKDPGRFRGIHPDAVKPNYEEAMRLLGGERLRGANRMQQIVDSAAKLFDATGARRLYVTLDVDGVVLLERGEKPYRLSCVPEHDVRTIGAGDTFTSALALALASGASSRAAARIASTAAAVALQKDGTSTCSVGELRAALKGNVKWFDNPDDLAAKLRELRKENKRIVFTNGCFDILHRGHVNFLRNARSLGDVLVVAMNSDASIRRIKGSGRPINSLADRIEVLAGLQSVDCLISFDSDTPQDLLELIRPDVFVKGEAHTAEDIPEVDLVRRLGGEVRIIPAAGLSTTQLIQKIQRRRSAQDSASGQQGAFRQ